MNVTVYSTPNCGACSLLKSYLSNNGVSYKEVNVAESVGDFDMMMEATGKTSVPQIRVDGSWYVGFSRKTMDKALKLDDFLANATATDAYAVCENCQ